MVFVHTPLMHSVDVSLTVVHAAPNVPAAGPSPEAASAGVFVSELQADRAAAMMMTFKMRFMDQTPGQPYSCAV